MSDPPPSVIPHTSIIIMQTDTPVSDPPAESIVDAVVIGNVPCVAESKVRSVDDAVSHAGVLPTAADSVTLLAPATLTQLEP